MLERSPSQKYLFHFVKFFFNRLFTFFTEFLQKQWKDKIF